MAFTFVSQPIDYMKKVLLITCFVLIYFALSAQENKDKEEVYKNRVGINAGFTTGYGFTYGYWHKKLGIQISFLPISTKEKKFFSLGISPFYTLNKKKYFKSYLFLGNHLVTNTKITEYNVGIGPGFEVGKRLVLSLRGGMGFFDVNKSFNMTPILEIGLFYKF